MGHIQLSRQADVILVAPATANIMSKIAYGNTDDLASTVLVATNKPIIVAPAMNVRMWLNNATQRNIQTLRNDGIKFVGPENGEMACGEYGEGRMSEPSEIIKYTIDFINGLDFKPLRDFSALVTSGPTKEMIDPVRFISNESSGKQGYTIAERLSSLGAHTTLISGPTKLSDPNVDKVVHVSSADEMMFECDKALPVNIAICAAAVADYKVMKQSETKIKKNGSSLDITLEENPDILSRLSKRNDKRPDLVVGFAAETEKLEENSKIKLEKKGCDWILGNNVSNGQVIGKDTNEIHFISKSGTEKWKQMRKEEVAEKLSHKIVQHLKS